MQISGAEALIKSLLEEGVDIVFGYPGGAIMPVYDALYDYQKELHHVLVRHEQGAAHAAEGYARISGKPGVCIATSGPGATNLVTGIADAMIDSVPIVCITGQVASHLVGTDAFQETDIIGITVPITKWNYQVTDPQEIPEIVAKAFYLARTGRPGPVLIDITKDTQTKKMNYSYKKVTSMTSYQPTTIPHIMQIKAAAKLLNNAEKPYMLIGHGVLIAKAEQEVKELVKKADIPVASTLHGLSSMESDNPRYVGMLGMHGNYGPNMLTNEADVILAVGMRFDDRVTGRLSDYATQAKIIHIDIDPAEINKNVKAEIPIVADAKNALQALLPYIKEKKHTAWHKEFAGYHKKEYAKIIMQDKHPLLDDKQPKMAEVIHMLSRKTKGDAIIVADVGQHQMITARYSLFNKPDSFVTSGGLGTMGFALPAAIGAKFARPERQVVAVVGDGCFQMTMQELITIAQEKIPVKIIILNNNFLGMVRQWQQMFYEKRYSFVELKNPNFIMIAKGCGIKAEKVDERKDMPQALDRMLKAKTPYLLEIVVEKEENVFPMVPSGASVEEIRLE